MSSFWGNSCRQPITVQTQTVYGDLFLAYRFEQLWLLPANHSPDLLDLG